MELDWQIRRSRIATEVTGVERTGVLLERLARSGHQGQVLCTRRVHAIQDYDVNKNPDILRSTEQTEPTVFI